MATITYPIKSALSIDTNRDYPVNQKVSWHGGIHILGMALNVQAIMDGTVVYARQKSGKHNQAPLNYQGATQDGCVLIKHTLKLPKGSVSVTFYSLYMHLMDVESTVLSKVGKTIKRGAKLGNIGMVNGQWAMHFQICCDLANFTNLVGRQQTKLDITKNGRTDCSYGYDHYYLPKGTELSILKQNKLIPMYKTDEPYYILTDYQATQIITEKSGNYDVAANTSRYIYNNHLRIKHLGQYAFFNLNSSSIKKYTDADFPHWQGWSVINDDRDQNSQCNSSTVLDWLDNKTLSAAQKNKLKKMAICNFPFEWTAATISTRFGWLKTSPPKGAKAFTDSDMKKFEEHIKALCFYDKLPEVDQKALRLRVWHFEPRAFIDHIARIDALHLPAFIYKTEKHAKTRKIYEDTPADMALAHKECEDLKYKDLTEQEILALPYGLGIPIPKQVMQGTLNEARNSDASLWRHLEKSFFSLLSTTGGEYKTVVKEMLAKFKANTGGIYKHKLIDQACADHKTTKEATNEIRDILSDNLKAKNGKLSNSDLDTIEGDIKKRVKLPKFDDWDWLNGLGITIHDTWSTHIILESLEVNGNKFKAVIRFRIQDHFGLGTEDITPYKFNQIRGFRNWFVLQRWDKYGYKPFITEFGTSKTIEGTF